MTLHPANLPAADYVSPAVRPFLAEFVKFADKVATASAELDALRGREDQAKLEDAAALGELARADLDVSGFGAPALTKHLADIRHAEAKLAGFERALSNVENDLRAEFYANATDGVQVAIDENARARARYEAAIAALSDAADAFNGSLIMLTSWRTYLADKQKVIQFNSRAGISLIDGGPRGYLEVPSIPTLASQLRDHATWGDIFVTQIRDAEARNHKPVPTAEVVPA